MDQLKRFGALLIGFYDKLLLGILLICLAGVMILQACSMKDTRELLDEMAGSLRLRNEPVPALNTAAFSVNVKLTRDDLWQSGFRPALPGAAGINTLSSDLREFLASYGEGTLFDPPVYMFSSTNRRYLVHFNTRYNPESGLDEQGTDVRIQDPRDPRDQVPDATVLEPLARNVYYRGNRQQKLPLMLANINRVNPMDQSTWDFQFDVFTNDRKRSYFVKIGDTIPDSGGFKLKSVDYSRERDANNVITEVASVVIERGGEEVILPHRQRIDYGSVVYFLAVLPPDFDRDPFFIEALSKGQEFSLTLNTNRQPRTERYKILDATARGATLEHLPNPDDPKEYDGQTFEVLPLTQDVMRRYAEQRSEARATLNPGMPFGPEF